MFFQIDGAIDMVEKKIDYLRKACLGYAISKNTIPIKIGTLFLAPSRGSRKLSQNHRTGRTKNFIKS